MNKTEHLQDIMESFTLSIENLKKAIGQRMYEPFIEAFKDSSKCVRELGIVLEVDRDENLVSRYREHIHDVVCQWLALTDDIEVWMAETKQEAERIHRNRLMDKKLCGAYSFIKKSGTKLRLYR
ncbi:MAG: hypothetical protein JXR78_17565 [Victivallales bacterium]|nr:hypothetical protein [Victivallales bacterium]